MTLYYIAMGFEAQNVYVWLDNHRNSTFMPNIFFFLIYIIQ